MQARYRERNPHNHAVFRHLLKRVASARDTNDFLTDKFYEHMVIKGRCKAFSALYLPLIF